MRSIFALALATACYASEYKFAQYDGKVYTREKVDPVSEYKPKPQPKEQKTYYGSYGYDDSYKPGSSGKYNGNNNGNFNYGEINGNFNGLRNKADYNGNNNGNYNNGSYNGNLNGNFNKEDGHGNNNGNNGYGNFQGNLNGNFNKPGHSSNDNSYRKTSTNLNDNFGGYIDKSYLDKYTH